MKPPQIETQTVKIETEGNEQKAAKEHQTEKKRPVTRGVDEVEKVGSSGWSPAGKLGFCSSPLSS